MEWRRYALYRVPSSFICRQPLKKTDSLHVGLKIIFGSYLTKLSLCDCIAGRRKGLLCPNGRVRKKSGQPRVQNWTDEDK